MEVNIFGSSGFAKEVYTICTRLGIQVRNFVDKNGGSSIYNIPIVDEISYDLLLPAIVAVGSPSLREKIVNKICFSNPNTIFPVLIDPSARILSGSIKISQGTIICAGTVVTCDVKLGEFTNLNLNTTIGHDCKLDDYFTTAPGVNISGNVKTGKKVYFGTNSACKENINIESNVTIGMCSSVINNINESGTFVGNPAIRL